MDRAALLASFVFLLLACDPDDAGSGDAGARDAAPDAAPEMCGRNADCDDGLFCNGAETCLPGDSSADESGCVSGAAPCGSGACDEPSSLCLPDDCTTPDADSDGHDRVACGGADCDDDDANRYPGNAEVCDPAGHDEDCDETTVGAVDDDDDGHLASRCCNGAVCGADCDDSRRDIGPSIGELCNAVDDDCDGLVDEAGAFCPSGICAGNRCRAVDWERVYASDGSQRIRGLHVDGAGNAYVFAVSAAAGADFDDDGLPDGQGGFVISYGPEGRRRWTTRTVGLDGKALVAAPSGEWIAVPDPTSVEIFATADGRAMGRIEIAPFDRWDNVELHGAAATRTELVVLAALHRLGTDGRPVERAVMLARYDAARAETGRLVVSADEPTDAAEAHATAIAAGVDRIVVSLTSNFDWAVGDTSVPSGAQLVVLDGAATDIQWRVPLHQTAERAAVADSGAVAWVGFTDFGATFAPPWTTSTWPLGGEADAYLASFDAEGRHRFTHVNAQSGLDANSGVDFDERGNILLTGQFSGRLDVTPRGSLVAVSGSDAFYVLLDENDGFVVEARAFPSVGASRADFASVDLYGGLVLGGTFFEGITLTSGTPYLNPPWGGVFITRISDF